MALIISALAVTTWDDIVQFIDLQSQYLAYKDEILSEMHQVLDTSSYVMGAAVRDLEDKLARFVGAPHAITCSSGTDALILALLAIDLKAGDEVIMPAFSFFATAETVSLLGGVPVFVDIEEDTFNINVRQIESHITEKTKAIMPVSLYGQVADMDAISFLAKKCQLTVIEDAAQSFGATYNGKMSGNLAEFGCVSFFPAKPLGAYGDGGAIFTQDGEMANKVRKLLNHGSEKRYLHEFIGINGRMDTLQAAVLKVKLKYFPEEFEKRQALAKRYDTLLSSLSSTKVITPTIKENCQSVYAQYSIRVKNREQVIKALAEKGIPVAVHYPTPIYRQPAYSDSFIDPKNYPISELISEEILSLPMSPFLTHVDQNKIVSAFEII